MSISTDPHVGWAYWLQDHWHLCADEPVKHARREPVLLRSQARAIADERLERATDAFNDHIARVTGERDEALRVLSEYSLQMEKIAAALRERQELEDGFVTAPIPEVHDEPEPQFDEDDSPFRTLPGFLDHQREEWADAMDEAGMEQ